MYFTVLGINHKTAHLDIRECFAFGKSELPGAMQTLIRRYGLVETMRSRRATGWRFTHALETTRLKNSNGFCASSGRTLPLSMVAFIPNRAKRPSATSAWSPPGWTQWLSRAE